MSIIIFKVIYYCKNLRNSAKVAAKWLLIKYLSIYLSICAARLVTGSNKYDHITPLMKQLHWLPISQRIIYQIVLITYKSLNGSAPHYINNMLKPYTPSANLRSLSKGLLTIPSVKLVNYGERSFSYAAPKLWNELPEYIRKSETLPIFKTRLKTHLFKQYYD